MKADESRPDSLGLGESGRRGPCSLQGKGAAGLLGGDGAVALMPPTFPRLPGGRPWLGFSLGRARELIEEEARDQEPGNLVSTPVLLLTSVILAI